LIRADGPDRLTAGGWDAFRAHGVRTVLDLRDPTELIDGFEPPAGITWVSLPLEDDPDPEFWATWRDSGLWATPLYYGPFIERWPERCAEVVRAVVAADPGGVLVACGRGRDRTGLAVLLLLAAVGVLPEAIAADYALSQGTDEAGESQLIDELLRRHDTTAEQAILDTLAALDIVSVLRAAGLTPRELSSLRDRLVRG